MSIQSNATHIHWKYLIAIERDLDTLSRFIEFDEANFGCYSIEIARLLLAAAAEVDVVCKQLCTINNHSSKAENINHYRDELAPAYPNVPTFNVVMPRYGLVLTPFVEWKQPNGVPRWWTAYNKTKHHRHTHFDNANLESTLNAIAGLFVMTLYLYRLDAESAALSPSAQLFFPDDNHSSGSTFTGFGFAVNYKL